MVSVVAAAVECLAAAPTASVPAVAARREQEAMVPAVAADRSTVGPEEAVSQSPSARPEVAVAPSGISQAPAVTPVASAAPACFEE